MIKTVTAAPSIHWRWAWRRSMATLLICTLLSGCGSLYRRDAYTGDYEASAQAVGSALGLAAGFALGGLYIAMANPVNLNNILIASGLIGLLTGSAIGYAMDKEEAAVRQQLLSSGVQIVENENGRLLLSMPTLMFRSQSAVIEPTYGEMLDALALILKQHPHMVALIIGYRDFIEPDPELGYRRAQAIVNALQDAGVPLYQLYPLDGERFVPAFWQTPRQAQAQSRQVTVGLAYAP